MSRGTSFGSWEKSQSISRTYSAPSASARWKPARYAGPSPSFRSRWRTDTKSSSPASRSAISPVPSGELSSTTSTRTPRGARARSIASRFSRSLYVGRQTVATGTRPEATYDRSHGRSAWQHGRGGPVRPARRPARARRGRVVPRPRLPAGGNADARDLRLDRTACTRRPCEGAAGNRQDDRGEDRPDRGAHEAPVDDSARGRAVHAAPRPRSEDGCAHLARARDLDARRAQGRRRGRAAARTARARREERGEDPQGAGLPGGQPG